MGGGASAKYIVTFLLLTRFHSISSTDLVESIDYLGFLGNERVGGDQTLRRDENKKGEEERRTNLRLLTGAKGEKERLIAR